MVRIGVEVRARIAIFLFLSNVLCNSCLCHFLNIYSTVLYSDLSNTVSLLCKLVQSSRLPAFTYR